MKLNKMPKDELESYSYIELAKMILKEKKKSLISFFVRPFCVL